MRESLIHMAAYRPLMVYLLVALLTGVLGSQLPRIQIDTDPENMLPVEQPERVLHRSRTAGAGASWEARSEP